MPIEKYLQYDGRVAYIDLYYRQALQMRATDENKSQITAFCMPSTLKKSKSYWVKLLQNHKNPCKTFGEDGLHRFYIPSFIHYPI